MWNGGMEWWNGQECNDRTFCIRRMVLSGNALSLKHTRPFGGCQPFILKIIFLFFSKW